MFDWDSQWHEGEEPYQMNRDWKYYASEYYVDLLLGCLLAIGGITWIVID